MSMFLVKFVALNQITLDIEAVQQSTTNKISRDDSSYCASRHPYIFHHDIVLKVWATIRLTYFDASLVSQCPGKRKPTSRCILS